MDHNAMKTLEELKMAGIDVDDAMERFMGNEELFRFYLKTLPEESSYTEMIEALKKEDVGQAFENAHRLKGVLGNLSITGAYNSICQIVETLRVEKLPSKEQIAAFVLVYEGYLNYVKKL